MTQTTVVHKETSLLASFRINLRFITNRCVATRVDARERPEWPPHPGRLYMALAAAYFETDGIDEDKNSELKALDWLAGLPSPKIFAAVAAERSEVACYVPVNDSSQPSTAILQSAPGLSRSRQSRAFPTVIPRRSPDAHETDPDVTYEWASQEDADRHIVSLDRLCHHVIRVGHSSSMVMAWAELGNRPLQGICWEPSETNVGLMCRVASKGELERLRLACRADHIELFARLVADIESESTSSKDKAKAKQYFEEQFGSPYKKSGLRPPEPIPPSLGIWQGYRQINSVQNPPSANYENSYFERDLVILSLVEGPSIDVERTLGLTQALRRALLAAHGQSPIPSWLSGHEDDGTPTTGPHAAFLTLPFAGYPHADGHLLGLAIAVPQGISAREQGRWLGPLLVNPENGEAVTPELTLWGSGFPRLSIQLEERPSPPLTLQNDTWTKPSTIWASVTPVVLDRFPKASRVEERMAWQEEVVSIVKLACTRAGLPEPSEVSINTTSWHSGIPRAWAKSRSIHGHDVKAPLGDGFPALPTKQSRPAKPQMHVCLWFDQPCCGPVIIGAGRFLGYGLCKPLEADVAKAWNSDQRLPGI